MGICLLAPLPGWLTDVISHKHKRVWFAVARKSSDTTISLFQIVPTAPVVLLLQVRELELGRT